MKLIPKASLAFKLKNAPSKTTFGQNVITALTPLVTAKKSIANFSDMPVPVAELQVLNDSLVAAVAATVDGGRAAAAALKAAVIAWNAGFAATANFISAEAEGNPMLILAAGFLPTKGETQPAQKPAAITNFKATINGTRGSIVASSANGDSNAKAYVVTAVPPGATVSYSQDTVIITINGATIYLSAKTRRDTELNNVPSGVAYSVSMFAINSAGSGPATPGQQVIPQ